MRAGKGGKPLDCLPPSSGPCAVTFQYPLYPRSCLKGCDRLSNEIGLSGKRTHEVRFLSLDPAHQGGIGGMHEVCHLRSTDRRRAQAGSATAPCEILLEVPCGAARWQSQVHMADRIRRLSQSALFRRVKSSLSSVDKHDPADRFAALVHQAAGSTVGLVHANGSQDLDASRDGSPRETGRPHVISNNRETIAAPREFNCE